MRVRPFWVLVPCFLLTILRCAGQEYLFARYTTKDGLINARARFLYQDSRGRLYVSTYGGLSVYDGARFVNYTTENGLSTSLVNDVVEMGDDSIWIVPNSRALHVMVHGVLHDIQSTDHFFPITNQLVKCSDGFFYAIADDGLFRWEGQRFVKIRLKAGDGPEAPSFYISGIESDGWLFILTDPLLGGYPGKASLIAFNLRTHQILTAGKPDYFSSLARSPSGEIFVTTLKGVRGIDRESLRKGAIRVIPPPAPYGMTAALPCNYMLFDRSGNLWLTEGNDIFKAGRDGTVTPIGSAGLLPGGQVNSLFQDRENNIWLANTQTGIARLVSEQVRLFKMGQPGFTVNDLGANPGNDSVWCYDFSHHNLMLLSGGTRTIFHGVGDLPPTGKVLFGQKKWLLAQNTIYEVQFLPGNRFQASVVFRDTVLIDGNACLDRRGRLIAASLRLTVVGDGRVWQRSILPSRCDQAATDQYNRIWAISRPDSLSLLTVDTTDGSTALRLVGAWKPIPTGSLRSIAVGHDGKVWVGTRDHGVYCLLFEGLRLRSIRQLTVTEGLSENFVRYLYCDGDNTVWVGTPSGLDRIDVLRNDSFAVTHILPGNEMQVDRVTRSADGTHWVVVDGAYLQIAPAGLSPDKRPPPVLFSQVFVGNDLAFQIPGQPLSLRHDQRSLSFNVAVPSFTDESQVRFSYLLEGSTDAQWSAPSHQTAINFVNLPPGKYTLHVKARFISGLYPDVTGEYVFVIRPPWWQTMGFRVTVVLLLAAGIGWGIRRYTQKRLEAQRILLEGRQAIEKERTRIATDMHDDLGAGLSRIKFLSDTIGIKQQRQQPIEEEIDGIREYSKEMIDKMGEIVWALNQKNDLLSDLLSYTRSYAAAYLMQAGIRSRIDLPEEFPNSVVSGEFRRNVYLAVKEALHNIVKHAQAQEVSIRMEVGLALAIVLEDDGVGFDRGTVRPFSNGLHNMEQRIGELGGELVIATGRTGTRISIRVPV